VIRSATHPDLLRQTVSPESRLSGYGEKLIGGYFLANCAVAVWPCDFDPFHHADRAQTKVEPMIVCG